MTDQGNNLDDHFREKLEDLEINPSERVWSGIASHLDQKRRRPLWVWWLNGIGVLIVAGALAAGAFNGSSEKTLAENSAKEIPAEKTQEIPAVHASNTTDEALANAQAERPGIDTGSKNKNVATSTQNKAYAAAGANTGDNVSPSSPAQINSSSQTRITRNTADRAGLADKASASTNNNDRSSQASSLASGPAQKTQATDPTAASAANEAASAIPMIEAMLDEEQRQNDISSVITAVPSAAAPADQDECCPKWSIGINYAYGVTYRHLKEQKVNSSPFPDPLFPPGQFNKAHYDSIEFRGTGSSKGISVNYNLYPRVTISAGLDISRYSWATDKGEGVIVSPNDPKLLCVTSTGYFSTDTLGDISNAPRMGIAVGRPAVPVSDTVLLVQNFSYTSIPLSLSYSLTKPCAKFGVAVKAGAAMSFLKSHRIILDGETIVPEQVLIRKRALNLMAGVALSYSPLENLTIEMQPVYRRFVQPVNRFKSTTTYPYMLGVQGGMYFRF